MKHLFFYAVTLLVIIFHISCKKTDNIIKPPDFNKPNKGCLLANSGDPTGFGSYDLSFTYNAKGNPETFAGRLKILYDVKDRLYRQQINDSNYVQWNYPDANNFLPASSQNYDGGKLVSTVLFSYDDSGKLVKSDLIYVNGFASGEVIWNYTYDIKNNVQTIIQEGVTIPIFQAKSYDDKPNFAGANQWIKYILNDPGSGFFFNYLLFSANNVTEWSVTDSRSGFIAPTVNCYYKYNSDGFPVSDSTVFRDPVNGDYSDVQTNSFKCQ